MGIIFHHRDPCQKHQFDVHLDFINQYSNFRLNRILNIDIWIGISSNYQITTKLTLITVILPSVHKLGINLVRIYVFASDVLLQILLFRSTYPNEMYLTHCYIFTIHLISAVVSCSHSSVTFHLWYITGPGTRELVSL